MKLISLCHRHTHTHIPVYDLPRRSSAHVNSVAHAVQNFPVGIPRHEEPRQAAPAVIWSLHLHFFLPYLRLFHQLVQLLSQPRVTRLQALTPISQSSVQAHLRLVAGHRCSRSLAGVGVRNAHTGGVLQDNSLLLLYRWSQTLNGLAL